MTAVDLIALTCQACGEDLGRSLTSVFSVLVAKLILLSRIISTNVTCFTTPLLVVFQMYVLQTTYAPPTRDSRDPLSR